MKTIRLGATKLRASANLGLLANGGANSMAMLHYVDARRNVE
jgi:hypothetical protein